MKPIEYINQWVFFTIIILACIVITINDILGKKHEFTVNEKKTPTTFVKCSTHQGNIFVECSRFPTVYIYIYIMRFSFGMA